MRYSNLLNQYNVLTLLFSLINTLSVEYTLVESIDGIATTYISNLFPIYFAISIAVPPPNPITNFISVLELK